MDLISQGGVLFMFPILLLLITIIVLIAKEIFKRGNFHKSISLIASLALFTIVWGFLGQIIGLIGAFDAIEMAGGNVSMSIIAAGLKVSFLPPVFALVTFLIGRLGIIFLTWRHEE